VGRSPQRPTQLILLMAELQVEAGRHHGTFCDVKLPHQRLLDQHPAGVGAATPHCHFLLRGSDARTLSASCNSGMAK
jgi:hypothetical protein